MIRTLFFLGLIAFAITAATVLIASWRMAERHHMGARIVDPVDVAIVLGGGHAPDLVLDYSVRQRVAVGVHLLKSGLVRNLIMTGGPVDPNPQSHASVMRDHAIALGAPPEAVMVEGAARTTLENFRLAYAIMDARGWTTYALVTDSYHMSRSVELARYLGRPPDGIATARSFEALHPAMKIATTLRETSAWWYNLYKIGTLWVFATFGLPDELRDLLVV